MNKILKYIVKEIGLVLVAAIVGLLLLCAVYLIPQEAMRDRTAYSVSILRDEVYSPITQPKGWFPDISKDSNDVNFTTPAGMASELLQGIDATRLDNLTDGLMLNASYYQTGNVVKDALYCEFLSYADGTGDWLHVLYDYIWSANKEYQTGVYCRYWHGYRVVLRPLLTVCSISTIRLLNMTCQLVGVIVVFMLLVARKRSELAIPFFVMWLSLVPLALFYSLQYSTAFYPMLLGCLGVCIETDKQSLKRLCVLFEICGIMLAYFDLLTYPVVVLGVPLIFYLSLDADVTKSVLERIKEVVALGLSWCAGYLGMWAGKWILTNMLTDLDAIENAIESIKIRTSAGYEGEHFTYLETLSRNMVVYKEPVFLLMVVIAVAAFVFLAVKTKHIRVNRELLIVMSVCIIIPFVWYLVTINHSYVHARFTFRELSISIYTLLSLLYVNVRASDIKKKDASTCIKRM